MGFLGLFGGDSDTPDAPKKINLDAGTQKLIDEQSKVAGQDPSHFSGILNRGIDTPGLGQTQGQVQQESAREGGADNGNIQAIHNAYSQQAEQGINQLKSKNEMQGHMMKADYMNQLSQSLLGQQAQAVQQQQFLTNIYMQQEQARAQAISDLFQVGNQAIGMNARMKGGDTQSQGGNGSGSREQARTMANPVG